MLRTVKTAMAIALIVGALFTAGAGAQSGGGPYRVDPVTIANGGGGTASGGTFRLSGTFGQATTSTLAAADYRFYGGFWAPLGPASDGIFANGFEP
ncbi:MAG TPA: hypothetical protein VFG55_00140 [Rhodanobacteraceae bacterium]|nr:hypothetical protein [Rhodanobacteraceae bacterium]